MIQGYCTVCQDVISHVNGQEQDEIATGPCGHVFHFNCLKTWLRQKASCPKCRHKITKPITIYLDEEEHSTEPSTSNSDDVQTLRGKLEHLKRLVKKKDEENIQIVSDKIQAEDMLQEMRKQCSSVEKKLSSEKSLNTALKKQMAFLKKQEVEVAEAKKEAMSSKQELQRFTRLKILVEGSKDDVEDMLNGIRGDGGATAEMITQLVILKRELERIKESRNKQRQVKENYERELAKLKHEVSTKDIEINKLTEQLNMTESDLTRTEKETSSLKKKLSKLEAAFNSPSPRSSAISRLMMESPAPMELKRPRLTPFEDDSDNDILVNKPSSQDDSDNDILVNKPSSQDDSDNDILVNKPYSQEQIEDSDMEKAAKWVGVPIIKTTTMHLSQSKAPTNQPRPLLQPRKRPANDSTVIRKGYDGFGGHTTFLKPLKPSNRIAKKVSRPNAISKFVKTKTRDGKDPPLPVMNLDDI